MFVYSFGSSGRKLKEAEHILIKLLDGGKTCLSIYRYDECNCLQMAFKGIFLS